MKGHVDALPAIKYNGRQVLIEEGFEHDNFVSIVQKRREDSVHPYHAIVIETDMRLKFYRMADLHLRRSSPKPQIPRQDHDSIKVQSDS